jgi:type I restriction enzyme, S subunit
MNWIQVKMSSFLEERKQHFSPQDKEISGLQRIEKIDFSGKIYLSYKPSKTKMILIKNNDLVISGINVAKGAMNVYYGEKDILATIHYSSYVYDNKKIDIHFLQYFLKSAEFKLLLKNQVPGGIKTEIKPKHLLPLKVFIPNNIEDQKKIVNYLNHQTSRIQLLSNNINYQNQLLPKLKQSILKESIEGKLSKDWREENQNIEPACELLERVKAVKEQLIADKKIKREKPLPKIIEKENSFKLPNSWTWCRLGDIIILQSGSDLVKSKYNDKSNGVPYLTGATNFKNNEININRWTSSPKSISVKGDLL